VSAGAVDEVPRAKGALLALHDQQRFAVEDEEVLLVGLPVVHRHRLARREDPQVDPDLREARGSLEDAKCAAAGRGSPGRVAGVEDEPAVIRRHEPVLGRLEWRLRSHVRSQFLACRP
jgi:hypothetical protein